MRFGVFGGLVAVVVGASSTATPVAATFTDTEATTVTVAAGSLQPVQPAGCLVNATSQSISWTPPAGGVAPNGYFIAVSDGQGGAPLQPSYVPALTADFTYSTYFTLTYVAATRTYTAGQDSAWANGTFTFRVYARIASPSTATPTWVWTSTPRQGWISRVNGTGSCGWYP